MSKEKKISVENIKNLFHNLYRGFSILWDQYSYYLWNESKCSKNV